MKNSVITIHYKRNKQLNNMLRGIALSNLQPDEILIINMGHSPQLLKITACHCE